MRVTFERGQKKTHTKHLVTPSKCPLSYWQLWSVRLVMVRIICNAYSHWQEASTFLAAARRKLSHSFGQIENLVVNFFIRFFSIRKLEDIRQTQTNTLFQCWKWASQGVHLDATRTCKAKWLWPSSNSWLAFSKNNENYVKTEVLNFEFERFLLIFNS